MHLESSTGILDPSDGDESDHTVATQGSVAAPIHPLLALLREAVFPFDSPNLEAEFIRFIFAPSVAPPTVVFAILGVIFVVVQFVFAANPAPTDRPIDPELLGILICGCICFILSALCAVCWRKSWWSESHHIERWWFAVAVTWQFGVNVQTNDALSHFCVQGTVYETALPTNTTASQNECWITIIDGWQLTTVATLLIGAPRVQLSLLILAIDVVTTFAGRWIFVGAVSFLKGEGFRLFYYLFFAGLLCSRELLQRRRFLAHHALKKKMANSTKARQAVEMIMANILPASIIGRLVRKEVVVDHCHASVLYSDIAGFTTWSSTRKAILIVKMLNSMYRRIDADVERFGIDKITTIGDAYWAACGMLSRIDRHATRLCAFGLQMQRHVAAMRADQAAFNGVHIRVGVSSGEVTGGIVGTRQLAYQVFGPINEEAEHMEQLAPVDTLLVANSTSVLLSTENAPLDAERGRLNMIAGPVDETFVVVELPWSPLPAPNGDEGGTLAPTTPAAYDSVASPVNVPSPSTPHDSTMTFEKRGDRRSFLLGEQRRSKASSTAGVGDVDGVDLVAFRERLSERAHFLRLDFVDAETEAAFRDYAANTYRSHAASGVNAGLNAAFLFVAIIIMASETAAEPHSPASFAVYSLLFATAAACAAFAPYIPVYVSWFRLGLDFVAQLLVISFLMNRKVHWSMLSTDIIYLTMIYAFLFTQLGAPALSWLVGVAYGYAFFVVTVFVAYYLRGRLTAYLALNYVFGFAALFGVGLRRMESELRSQFLDERVAVVAEEQISAEKADLEALLARSVPTFVLPELVEWLSSDRESSIAHQLQHASIMFVRVPAVAAQCADAHADALTHVSGLVALYDETLVAADVSTVIKIKTIGDILLLAAGLHRHGRYRPSDVEEAPTAVVDAPSARAEAGQSSGRKQAFDSISISVPRVCAEDVRSLVFVGARLQRAVHDKFGHDIIAGVHMGAVVSGVLGDERLVYDCFSDVANVASRIMSTCRPENGDAGVWVSELVAAALTALQLSEQHVVAVGSDHTSHVRIAVHLTPSPSSGADDKPCDTQLCGSVTVSAPVVRKMKGKGDVAVHKVTQATDGVQ